MTTGTKRLVCTALVGSIALATAYGPAKAQTIIEMSALKCGDYLEAPAERREQFAAWMSGYFNAERNMPMVDLKRFATNKKKVEQYCRSHKKDNLMSVIRKVSPSAAQDTSSVLDSLPEEVQKNIEDIRAACRAYWTDRGIDNSSDVSSGDDGLISFTLSGSQAVMVSDLRLCGDQCLSHVTCTNHGLSAINIAPP
jgi:hypothetical protein